MKVINNDNKTFLLGYEFVSLNCSNRNDVLRTFANACCFCSTETEEETVDEDETVPKLLTLDDSDPEAEPEPPDDEPPVDIADPKLNSEDGTLNPDKPDDPVDEPVDPGDTYVMEDDSEDVPAEELVLLEVPDDPVDVTGDVPCTCVSLADVPDMLVPPVNTWPAPEIMFVLPPKYKLICLFRNYRLRTRNFT